MKGIAIMAGVNAAALAASLPNVGLAAMGEIREEPPHRSIPQEPTIPDHVSVERDHPNFWELYYLLGVRVNGRERLGDVHEFCVSEGWARVRSKGPNGRPYDDGTGHFATEIIHGTVEPYLKRLGAGHKTLADAERLKAAEEKRARKAAKIAARQNG